MKFKPKILKHQERVDWFEITHVRLTGRAADTVAGQRILGHIKKRRDKSGVARLENVLEQFLTTRKRRGPRAEA